MVQKAKLQDSLKEIRKDYEKLWATWVADPEQQAEIAKGFGVLSAKIFFMEIKLDIA